MQARQMFFVASAQMWEKTAVGNNLGSERCYNQKLPSAIGFPSAGA
jgi:hypothetical protein